jgi:hypothetical protein
MPHYQFFVLSNALIVKEVGAIALANDSVARGLGTEMIGHLAATAPERDGWSFMITSGKRLVANVPFSPG